MWHFELFRDLEIPKGIEKLHAFILTIEPCDIANLRLEFACKRTRMVL